MFPYVVRNGDFVPDWTAPFVTTSDLKGNYKFEGIPSAWYFFRASEEGWNDAELIKVDVLPERRTVVDLGLDLADTSPHEARGVEGKVLSADREPIENATVTLTALLNPDIFLQTRTDRSGQFEISSWELGGGVYLLTTFKLGFEPGVQVVWFEDLGKDKTFLLKPRVGNP
jgi:hypothetical protein